MKVVHWSPLENAHSILQEGLKLADSWTSASILSPHHDLNRWWLDFQFRDRPCKGFVFELQAADFPLAHGHWIIDSDRPDDAEPPYRRFTIAEIAEHNPHCVFDSLEALKREYFHTFVWRIGEQLSSNYRESESYFPKGLEQLRQDQNAWARHVADPNLLPYTFEDYQVLLSKPISPERIERVLEPDEPFPYVDLVDEIEAMIQWDWSLQSP